MLKLYKPPEAPTVYWEAWSDGTEVTIHWGTVGHEGESRSIQLESGDNPNVIINQEAAQRRAEGYREIKASDMYRMIIQLPITGMGTVQDLDQRKSLEESLNEELGWTGLGHCDGGDIGSGTMNIFCFVVDPGKAMQRFQPMLAKKGLLGRAVIVLRVDQEETKVLWPENFTGKFRP